MKPLRRCALAGLLSGCVSTAVYAQAPPQLGRWIGHWSGVAVDAQGSFRTERAIHIEFRAAADGLEFLEEDPGTLRGGPTMVRMSGQDQIAVTWQALFPGEMTGEGRLDKSSRVLTLHISGGAMNLDRPLQVDLRRDEGAARAFEVPRLGADHVRQLEYRYLPARRQADGWPAGSLASAHIDAAPIQQLMQAVLKQTGEPGTNITHSLLMARSGSIVLEEYFWGYRSDLAHGISSCTKSLTSMIAGAAADEGLLVLSDRVAVHFKDYPQTKWIDQSYPISVEQLFSMDAGLEWNEDVPYDDPQNSTRPLLETDNPTAFILNRPLAAAPGTQFRYNSALPMLAGTLLSRIVHEPIERFGARKLLEPLGIKNYRWFRSRDGSMLAAGGFSMLPRDMLKLGQLMLNGGTWRGHRILSETWVKSSTARHTPEDQYAYGLYWHLITPKQWQWAGQSGYLAAGQGGQFIIVIPALELVAVITSGNWQAHGTPLAYQEAVKFMAAAVR
jgi:CubicO group peptidase (beta-lactamase class C family)